MLYCAFWICIIKLLSREMKLVYTSIKYLWAVGFLTLLQMGWKREELCEFRPGQPTSGSAGLGVSLLGLGVLRTQVSLWGRYPRYNADSSVWPLGTCHPFWPHFFLFPVFQTRPLSSPEVAHICLPFVHAILSPGMPFLFHLHPPWYSGPFSRKPPYNPSSLSCLLSSLSLWSDLSPTPF